MGSLKKIGRLFEVKTRFEAWLVIYAIALGAVERGKHYLETYPGFGGWLLALACTGVVFVAGGKLLDAVKSPMPLLETSRHRTPARRPSAKLFSRRVQGLRPQHATRRSLRRID